MKYSALSVLAVIVGATSYSGTTAPILIKGEEQHTINAILGDESFVRTFGLAPDEKTNERVRIETHLAYVEKLLRSRDVSTLPPELRHARRRNLDILNEYRKRGRFPMNEMYPTERRPCFIDRKGNICAVGYLIEQSAGREAAESINREYQYAYVADMESEAFREWTERSGLTVLECAMIQPAYNAKVVAEKKMDKGVEIASMGIGAASTIVNGIFTGMGDRNYVTAGIGFLSGTAGIVLGMQDHANYGDTDIIFGGVAVVVSLANVVFAQSEKPGKPRVEEAKPYLEVNLALLPLRGNRTGVGISLQWRM